MDLTIELRGLDQALRELEALGERTAAALTRALVRISHTAKREAIRHAPRSPSMKILRALRKTKRRVTRKDRATSRASPGGLERSIEVEVIPSMTSIGSLDAIVFVSANSEAGQYAARIHDGKGTLWNERGPGTVAKGARADALFIERAVRENEGEFVRIVQDELGKVLKT